jgi:cytochrome c oxidase subunit IV
MADVHASHDTHTGEIAKPNTKAIWRTFWILLIITTIEFVVALAPFLMWIPHTWKVVLYAIMTIMKAAYIVGEFMHLKHEVKFLIYAILLPMVFVAWLLLAMIWEGGSIFDLRY